MRELLKNRRIYCIFVALSFLVTFVLPLFLSALYNNVNVRLLPIESDLRVHQFILSLIRTALDVVKTFPTALLLFAAMRWKFWYSVPVVISNILYMVVFFIRNMIQPGLSPQYLFSLVILAIAQTISIVVIVFFYLKITRSIFLRIKNNFITVPAMLMIMLVVGNLNTVLWTYVISLFLPISSTGFSLYIIIDYFVRTLPDTLLHDLYICIGYIILYFGAKFYDKRQYRLNTDQQS